MERDAAVEAAALDLERANADHDSQRRLHRSPGADDADHSADRQNRH
jgi:hypothetical protein